MSHASRAPVAGALGSGFEIRTTGGWLGPREQDGGTRRAMQYWLQLPECQATAIGDESTSCNRLQQISAQAKTVKAKWMSLRLS